MKFLRNHWYDLGLIPLAISIIYLIMNWGGTSVLRRLAMLNFIVIFWHQFEEYRFPGGEPAITNMAMQPQTQGSPDRFPLNQNNAMIINVAAAYCPYLLPVLFPGVIWLGFMPVVFGISQFMVHGVMTPRKIGNKIYSPGLCAVLFGHVPVGIYWLYYTITNNLLNLQNVLGGVIYLAIFVGGFMMKIGYGILQNPDSPYAFPEEEFERGGYAEKIRNLMQNSKQM